MYEYTRSYTYFLSSSAGKNNSLNAEQKSGPGFFSILEMQSCTQKCKATRRDIKEGTRSPGQFFNKVKHSFSYIVLNSLVFRPPFPCPHQENRLGFLVIFSNLRLLVSSKLPKMFIQEILHAQTKEKKSSRCTSLQLYLKKKKKMQRFCISWLNMLSKRNAFTVGTFPFCTMEQMILLKI